MGAFRTSPVDSLLAKVGILPLQIRQRQALVFYAIAIRQFSGPTYHVHFAGVGFDLQIITVRLWLACLCRDFHLLSLIVCTILYYEHPLGWCPGHESGWILL